MKQNFSKLLAFTFLLIFSASCNTKLSKTSIYDFNKKEGWVAFEKDAKSKINAKGLINEVSIKTKDDNTLDYVYIDELNESNKALVDRHSYKSSSIGYLWALSGGTPINVTDPDTKQLVKDLTPYTVPINDINLSKIGEAVEAKLKSMPNAILKSAQIIIGKKKEESGVEIVTKQGTDEKTISFDLQGKEEAAKGAEE